MSTELLPCPFCGGGQTIFKENGKVWTGMRWGEPASVSVQHWCERITGQPSRMIERVGRDKESAIAAWNLRPSADAGAAGVPQGWKLVPIEPTPEMERFICNCDIRSGAKHDDYPPWKDCYRAMLDASPTAPALPQGWVSVEERMPEPETECLVYGKSAWAKEPYVRIDTWAMQREAPLSFSSATIETGYGWDDADFDDITHWMPLPTAPSTQQHQSADSEGGEVA